MADDLTHLCDTTRYTMEMLLPFRCKYCTQHFENSTTFLKHKSIHELRYRKFWHVSLKRKKKLLMETPKLEDNLRYMYYDDSDGEIVIYQYRDKNFVKLFNYKVFEEIPIAGRNLPCQYMFPPKKIKGMSVDTRKPQRKGGGIQKVIKQFVKKVGKKYACTVCSKSFNKAYLLELHERSHSIRIALGLGAKVKQKLFCKICSKVFHQADILELHERSHAFKTLEKKSLKRYGVPCIAIEKIILDAENKIKVNGTHKCKYCTQCFSDLAEWKLHERSHTFMNSKQKILMLKIHETAQAFADSAAEATKEVAKKVAKQESKRAVKQTGQSLATIKLPICVPSLTKRKSQGTNKALGLEKSPRKIPAERVRLQKVTKQLQEQLFKKEVQTISPVSEQYPRGQLLPCRFCNMKFKTVNELAQHDKIHAKKSATKRPFQCGLCGKYFTQSGSLRAHERIHTGERPYSCKQCSKSFHESGKLKRHERTHTGEKPYGCCWCGKRFTQNGTRKSHERTHREMYETESPGITLAGTANPWAAALQTSHIIKRKK